MTIPVRVTTATAEEAFFLSMQFNLQRGLTTAELAFRIAELRRLDFTSEAIERLYSVGCTRYEEVGRCIDPTWFTNAEKRCDPPITWWFEAAQQGSEHFQRCFVGWDQGWDEATCLKMFRQQKVLRGRDFTEIGFRSSRFLDRYSLRGRVDLAIHSPAQALKILEAVEKDIREARRAITSGAEMFGAREVRYLNPLTLDEL